MSTPIPLAPYPPDSLRASIPPPEWSAIIESWNTALSVLLQLPSAKFTTASSSDNLTRFLSSYLAHSPITADTDAPQKSLRKKTFLVLHRVLTAHPKTLLDIPGFLVGFSRVYSRVPAAQRLLEELWKTQETSVEAAIKALKKTHLPVFSKAKLSYDDAAGLGRLFQMSPKVAAMLLAGDEFEEVVLDGDEVVVKLFARALCEAARANWSVVVDELYALTAPSAGQKEHMLAKKLAELGVGSRLKVLAEGTDHEGRVAAAVEKLRAYGAPPRRKKQTKDKGKAVMTPQDHEEAEIASKVDQIRDLFPDLDSGFVQKCLQALGGDVEVVTSALLEDNLPAELIEADRSEEYIPLGVQFARPSSSPAPPSLPERKNVFDNDALDRLDPATLSKLTSGRRANDQTADALLAKSEVPKSAILSALAAFDSDDDERDDTYDAADVGGAVDADEGEAAAAAVDDEKEVWAAYQRAPQDFERAARGGNARKALKESTGWTDEALEGWAVMLNREPERQRKLERKYAVQELMGRGQHAQIERTSWRAGEEETERGRGPGRGRGRGRGMGKGGGEGSQQAPPGGDGRGRARKEQNKGRVGNHGRREGRARKMAKGFGAGPA